MHRSSSIDSVVDVVWSGAGTLGGSPTSILDVNAVGSTVSGSSDGPAPFSKRSSANSLFATSNFATSGVQLLLNYANVGGVSVSDSGGNRRESVLSPSSSRRNKMSRTVNGKCNLGCLQIDF